MVFGGLDESYSDYGRARFAVLPVPYERTTSYLRGTAKAPKAIIEASCNMELYDEEADINAAESGIATLETPRTDVEPDEMVGLLGDMVGQVLSDGKIPVVLGGEHSLSTGPVRAINKLFGDLTVLQFDAHADLRDSYEGSKHNHACVMSRIRECCSAVQVGIRSLSDDEAGLVKKLRGEGFLYFARDILEGDCVSAILDGLSDNVYITFDVDCLDPSIMPTTGTPEPGGLGWYESLRILRSVCENRSVRGFDIVEHLPNPNLAASDYTCARLAYKIMGYMAKN
jgi:agmatinase